VPPRLEDIVLKCLEKDPENRYQSVKELAVDLQRLAAPSAAETAATPAERPRILRCIGLGAALAAGALLAALVGLRVGRPRNRAPDRAASLQIQSIAVLPLENLSGDPEQEYFAVGMTDELITDLAQIGALRVISRTSVMHYKGTNKTVP
jgi:hypothetical protein